MNKIGEGGLSVSGLVKRHGMTHFQFPGGRTGIYRHSWRDLVRATRKIRCANEPVV